MFKTHEAMGEAMDRLLDECRATRSAGLREYAGGDNTFGNFVRIGEMLSMPPESVLWVYAVKHFDGIAAWIRGHRSQREDVRGRIKDAIVYLCLLAGMAEERASETPDAEDLGIPPHCPVRSAAPERPVRGLPASPSDGSSLGRTGA